jgi:LysM repeat protein
MPGAMRSLQQQAEMGELEFVHEGEDRGFLRSSVVAGHGLMRTRRRSLNGSGVILCRLQCADGRQVLLLLFSLLNLALMMMMMHGAGAQQAYNDVNGYTCSSTALQSQSCTSYTLYRTQSSKETLTSVSTLFNTSASVITTTSSLKVTSNDTYLPSGTPLYIPLACNCVHRRSYQGNESRTTYEATVSWHIVRGNTFWIIANEYYAGLTTYQAIEAANPTQVPTDLHIHSYSTIPLRCACPSATQLGITKFLLSFVLFPAETSLAVVSSYFNISIADLEAANQVNASTTLQPFSTLLVPLLKLPPLSSIPFVHAPSSVPGSASPKSAAGFPSSPSPSSASSSNKNLYIGVGIGIGLGFFLASMLGIFLLLVCLRKKKKMKKMDPGYVAKYNLGFETVKNISATKDSGGDGDSTEYNALLAEKVSDVVGSDKPMVFSYEELREATMNFSDAKRIRGSVFLGKLRGMLVAIKQMKGNNMAQELKILTKVHHSNLVHNNFALSSRLIFFTFVN